MFLAKLFVHHFEFKFCASLSHKYMHLVCKIFCYALRWSFKVKMTSQRAYPTGRANALGKKNLVIVEKSFFWTMKMRRRNAHCRLLGPHKLFPRMDEETKNTYSRTFQYTQILSKGEKIYWQSQIPRVPKNKAFMGLNEKLAGHQQANQPIW